MEDVDPWKIIDKMRLMHSQEIREIWMPLVKEWRDNCSAMQARIDELSKDAARYRFAKSNKSQGRADIVIVHKIWGGDQLYLSGDKADAAIDKAMKD